VAAVQYSTAQYSIAQYSTAQYSTAQYSTVQYSTVQYSTAQYSTVQYTFTHNKHNDTKQTIHRTTQLICGECWPCSVFASYTLAFALQLRKRHGKTSVRVAEECQLAR